jgi:hypothetical protein
VGLNLDNVAGVILFLYISAIFGVIGIYKEFIEEFSIKNKKFMERNIRLNLDNVAGVILFLYISVFLGYNRYL